MIPYMPEGFYSEHQYQCEVHKIRKLSTRSHTLRINPDAWMEAFGSYNEEDRKEQNELVLQLIELQEAKFRRLRQIEGRTVIGQAALRAAHLETQYLSKNRDGKKMWCICDDIDLRVRYIQWAKAIKQKARDVYERWKVGDFTLPFPPGVFAPTRPMLANKSQHQTRCWN